MSELKFHMPTRLAYDAETATPFYTRFVAQPFERGWATTVGNAMRRILLSSVPGAAITAVKIAGVVHEFSTIPGVKEDVTHIVLNLKKVPIILQGVPDKILHLKASGRKDVKAGDFDEDSAVTVVDPNAHIATLDNDGEIELWCRVRAGNGYVTAEDNKEADLDVHYIILDSIHNPIRKVNFRISPARVGRVHTYEKLDLEVWTNGAIRPLEGVLYAADLLLKHIELFKSEPEIAGEAKKDEDALTVAKIMADDPLDRPVDELDISTRAINCLKNANVDTLRKLVQLTEKDILNIKNFGRKSLVDLKKSLGTLGFSLKGAKGE